MGKWTHRLQEIGDFLTTIPDFRGWGVRGLAGVPRGVRDGAGGTLGTQKRMIFGPELAPTGPHNGPQRSRLCKKVKLGMRVTEAQLGLEFQVGLECACWGPG